jgi:hypothetical protein
VYRLPETSAQPGAEVSEHLVRQQILGAQINPAIVERKEYPVKFPVVEIAQQPEPR